MEAVVYLYGTIIYNIYTVLLLLLYVIVVRMIEVVVKYLMHDD